MLRYSGCKSGNSSLTVKVPHCTVKVRLLLLLFVVFVFAVVLQFCSYFQVFIAASLMEYYCSKVGNMFFFAHYFFLPLFCCCCCCCAMLESFYDRITQITSSSSFVFIFLSVLFSLLFIPYFFFSNSYLLIFIPFTFPFHFFYSIPFSVFISFHSIFHFHLFSFLLNAI